MSFLKKPLRKLTGSLKSDRPNDLKNEEGGLETHKNGSASASVLGKIGNGTGTPSGASTPPDDKRKSRELLRDEKVRRSLDLERKKVEAKKRQSMRRIESEAYMRDAPPELTKLYKPFSMNMSKRWDHEKRILFKELDFSSTPLQCDGKPPIMFTHVHWQNTTGRSSLSELESILFVE